MADYEKRAWEFDCNGCIELAAYHYELAAAEGTISYLGRQNLVFLYFMTEETGFTLVHELDRVFRETASDRLDELLENEFVEDHDSWRLWFRVYHLSDEIGPLTEEAVRRHWQSAAGTLMLLEHLDPVPGELCLDLRSAAQRHLASLNELRSRREHHFAALLRSLMPNC